MEIASFVNFAKLPPKKPELLEKFELPDKKRFQTVEKRREHLALWPTPIHKLSMTSMVRNISLGQLGLAAWLCSLPAPAHLLIS